MIRILNESSFNESHVVHITCSCFQDTVSFFDCKIRMKTHDLPTSSYLQMNKLGRTPTVGVMRFRIANPSIVKSILFAVVPNGSVRDVFKCIQLRPCLSNSLSISYNLCISRTQYWDFLKTDEHSNQVWNTTYYNTKYKYFYLSKYFWNSKSWNRYMS